MATGQGTRRGRNTLNKESEARRKARLEAEQRRARAHFAANLDTIMGLLKNSLCLYRMV